MAAVRPSKINLIGNFWKKTNWLYCGNKGNVWLDNRSKGNPNVKWRFTNKDPNKLTFSPGDLVEIESISEEDTYMIAKNGKLRCEKGKPFYWTLSL